MNSENAKYPFSISDKMTVGFMGIFYISSSGKKRVSSGFSHFKRSLSFGGLLCWFLPCKGLLFSGIHHLKDRHVLDTF